MSSGVSQAADGSRAGESIEHFLRHGFDHVGGDKTGRNRVGGDALRPQFARPDAGHADHARFGGDVVGLAEVAVKPTIDDVLMIRP